MSKKLKSGMLWSVIDVAIKRMLDFVVKLILARLLFPEDFGLIGMAAVFISFVQVLNDAGMGLAIIQKKHLTDKHLNTVFWTNIGWSLLLYLVLSLVVAPLAADFYSQPLLIKVIPVLSISVLTSALNTVNYAQLRKTLSFKKIAVVRSTATFFAAIIAITMAWLDFGVWALVANEVAAYIITVPLYYNATRWFPKLQWDKGSLKEILSFGVFTTGTMIVANVVSNIDYLLLGRWVGASAVGAYTLAYMMTNSIMGQITTMIERVMYPFYSSVQDDLEMLKKYYLKIIRFYALALYPIMLTLFLFAEQLVPLFFGNKWGATIVPLKILSIAVMIRILTTGYNLLFRSIGQPKFEFKIQRITSLYVYLPVLVTGIYFYGIIGAAVGVLVSNMANVFVHQYILKKHFQISIQNLLKQNYRLIIFCIALIGLVYLLRLTNIHEYVIMGLYATVFGIVYLVLFRNDLTTIVSK